MSKVVRGREFRWQGVPLRAYKAEGEQAGRFHGVTRQTILGEGAGESDLNFITRYFEVEPGGFSSLELHRHPHSVIVVRGRGRVLLGGESHDLEPLDVVYVSPETVHQFQAGADEPLGFLCIVDRDRDRPRPA
jgi:quercetin dioxygenase-like cupin family protein